MKATVIVQIIYESTFEVYHGFGREVRRLVIPKLGGLSLTVYDGRMIIFRGINLADKESLRIIGEVDVPDEIVRAAVAIADAQEAMNLHCETISSLINF